MKGNGAAYQRTWPNASRAIGVVVLIVALLVPSVAVYAAGGPPSSVPVIPDASLKALSTTIGGASVLPTTRTVPHWWGSTLDPNNGVTYGYNMVGADPNQCSGSDCSVTIEADIVPVNVNVGGLSFNGTDVLAATLASPQFALNDYGSTPFATAGAPNLPRGPGRGPVAKRCRPPVAASGCDDAGAVQQNRRKQLPRDPAPQRPPHCDNRCTAESGRAAPVRSRRGLRRHQHQLVGIEDPKPQETIH